MDNSEVRDPVPPLEKPRCPRVKELAEPRSSVCLRNSLSLRKMEVPALTGCAGKDVPAPTCVAGNVHPWRCSGTTLTFERVHLTEDGLGLLAIAAPRATIGAVVDAPHNAISAGLAMSAAVARVSAFSATSCRTLWSDSIRKESSVALADRAHTALTQPQTRHRMGIREMWDRLGCPIVLRFLAAANRCGCVVCHLQDWCALPNIWLNGWHSFCGRP
eukprot:scaffold11275_cov108-Isochrysis_galbana.AAC.11